MSDGHSSEPDSGLVAIPAPLQSAEVDEIAATFSILGDPTRVRILHALAGGELCVCDLATQVGISESAASHQLRLLRGMRLVRPRRAGRQIFYSLDDMHIVELLRLAVTHVREDEGAALRRVPPQEVA